MNDESLYRERQLQHSCKFNKEFLLIITEFALGNFWSNMENAKTVSVLFCLFFLFTSLTFTDAFYGSGGVGGGKRSGINKVGYLQAHSINLFCDQDQRYNVTIVVDVLMESTN